MLKFIATAFGYVLNFIYNLVNNYGLAIIIFTILLKLILLPMSIKQQKTLKKTSKIQAEVKEIQEKYSNDQVKMNQEVMDLYKRENMSPFSGCLTSILQMIVLISIFYLVSSPLTYMRHIDQGIISEYATKLPETVRYREISIIKMFSGEDEKVRINMDFLGLNLSDVPSQDYKNPKVLIIPALYVVSSLFMMKLTKAMTAKNQKDKDIIVVKKENENKDDKDEDINEEEAVTQMTNSMSMIMPFMTVSIAIIAPLGLALYWLVSNILNIIERLVIDKVVKEEEE